jgi:hypothetical protein
MALLSASKSWICHPVMAHEFYMGASIIARSSHPRMITSWSKPVGWSWLIAYVNSGPSP